MSAWLIAVIGLLPPLAAAGWIGLRSAVPSRLVAVELATSLGMLALVAMSFAFDQKSLIDLALTLLFMVLQAPDVAYSELAVGTAAVPLMFLALLVSLRTDAPEPEKKRK